MAEKQDFHIRTDHEGQEPVSLDLLNKALRFVRSLVRGNGLDPACVRIKSFEGGVLPFTGEGRYKILRDVSEQQKAGREKGEIVTSVDQALQLTDATLQKIEQDNGVCAVLHESITKREDAGWAANRLAIPLSQFNRQFVIHEACAACKNTGSCTCPACRGKGAVICPRCHGSRRMSCPRCYGTKYMQNGGQPQPCVQCHGRGKVNCTDCQGRGDMRCRSCTGKGKISCRECSGSGWLSRLVFSSFKAQGDFSYGFGSGTVPDRARRLIEAAGTALVTQKQGQVEFLSVAAAEVKAGEDGAAFRASYKARVPFGHICFLLDKAKMDAVLFGAQARLYDVPDFLEPLIAKGRDDLTAAAQVSKGCVRHIRAAIRYRAVGEAVLATARCPLRKAVNRMKKRYPVGLSGKTIERMLSDSDRALKNVTRRQRYGGLLLGLFVVSMLYVLYYMGPVREALIVHVGSRMGALAIDLCLIALGGLLTTAGIRYSALRAYRRVLSPLIKAGQKNKLVPKAGKGAWIGYGAGLVIYVVVIEIARARGLTSPWWYGVMRDGLPF